MEHGIFAVRADTGKLDAIEAGLKDALAAGSVRNSALSDWKFTIGGAYWEERLPMPRHIKLKVDPNLPIHRIGYELEHLIPLSITHIGTWPKNLAKFEKKHDIASDPYLSQIRDVCQQFYERWYPIQKMVTDLKPMIVKGRAPSVVETPARDLTNTGSCACCARNVKLHLDRIVPHGYDIQWGFRNGSCPGVGYSPFEISPEGAIAYIESLDKEISRETTYKEAAQNNQHDTYTVPVGYKKTKQLTRADDGFERARKAAISQSEGLIRMMRAQEDTFKIKVDKWEPQILPDGRVPDSMHSGPTP